MPDLLNENVADHFFAILLEIAHKTIPQSSGQILPPRKPWFFLECKIDIFDYHQSIRLLEKIHLFFELPCIYEICMENTPYYAGEDFPSPPPPPPVPHYLSNTQVTVLPDIAYKLASQFSLISSINDCSPSHLIKT